MAERGYFGLRYALPGYTFILMAFLIIWPNVQMFFFQEGTRFDASLVSAFLVFFTLLEGSAIGFLVSQTWYWFYDFILRERRLRPAIRFLQDKYGLTQRDIHRQTAFLDYIVQLAEKQLLAYTERRWDLLHTLGSTLVAVLLGSFIGFLIRMYWHIPDPCLYDVFVIFVFLFFILFLYCGYRIVNREHEMMTLNVVRSVWHLGRFPPEDARRVFPEDYFQN
jgi:hypothetical protein